MVVDDWKLTKLKRESGQRLSSEKEEEEKKERRKVLEVIVEETAMQRQTSE